MRDCNAGEPPYIGFADRCITTLLPRLVLCAGILLSFISPVYGEDAKPDFERLADAIYRAEGGKKASVPYGIFYKGCSWNDPAFCRRICINTLKRAYNRFSSSGSTLPYLAYLSASYAPLGAKNDPSGLNRHWLTNVQAIYDQPRN